MKNYYKILGVERNAKILEIKKSFRKLVRKLHPDINKNENAHIVFVEINEAYEVLSNPIKRLQYNKLYDYQILNKIPKKKKRYESNRKKWEENVEKSAAKGHRKGNEYSTKDEKIFKRKMRKGKNSWLGDVLSFIFEILVDGVLRVILEFIFVI